tara:strand:+ start:89250 stop:89438 length:189 start_codon:yes stop_codon:yes gene_type:complete
MNDPTPASDDARTEQTLPYTEAEIETMASEDASAGRFLTKLLVCTFSYTIIVGAYVIYWSLN